MTMNDKERIEKHAKVLMLVVGAFIVMLLIIALSGCNIDWSNIDTTPLYWPEDFENIEPDTVTYEDSNIIYWEWDSVMDSVEMDCGE